MSDQIKLADRKCTRCHRSFKPTRQWQHFCSTKCRNAHHLEETQKARKAWRKDDKA